MSLQEEAEAAWDNLSPAVRRALNYLDWLNGYVAAAEFRDQRIRELQQALSDHALGTEGGGGLAEGRRHEGRCPLCIECGGYGTVGTDDLASIAHKPDCRVEGLLHGKGAEADPDVADTAWAIIAHHRQHRTAG